MEAVVEIHLPMGESAADEYFALEDTVTAALDASNLGYVDGNDIGQGEFTLFLIGPDGRALLEAVRPLLSADLVHSGAHAVIRNEKNDEVTEERVALSEVDKSEVEQTKPWQPVSFGAIKGGDSEAVLAFWVPFRRVWQALPKALPSTPTAARLIVIWQVAGEVWDKVDEEVGVNIESRRERLLGATVPIRYRTRTLPECQALIRESLASVLTMGRALISRKRLDWDLADVEGAINGIENNAAGTPGS
jgi:hypothetical protein